MRKERQLAIKLRRKGLSYNEINRKTGISKSTLSYWLSHLEISETAKKRLSKKVFEGSIRSLIERNKNQTVLARKRAEEIRARAINEAKKLIDNRLFLVGTSLYWAEGYKKGAYGSKWKAVDFANSDPELVRIMMKFFKIICGVSAYKIKAQLIAHKNMDINKAVHFWSSLTKIPKEQFIKTYSKLSISSKNKRNKHSLTYGTIHIRINDVKLFFRIIGWIEGLNKNI